MLFQSWVGAEQHNIHHKQPIMPITMWQISSLCLSQVVQYQTIHTIILSYLKIFRNTIHLQTFKPSNTLQLLIWSLQNEGYVSIAPDFKTKRNTGWSLSRPTGTYLKVRTKWKWKPSLSLLNNHQIKIQTLFFFFLNLWYRKPHAYSLFHSVWTETSCIPHCCHSVEELPVRHNSISLITLRTTREWLYCFL